jgi:hypothetical protein
MWRRKPAREGGREEPPTLRPRSEVDGGARPVRPSAQSGCSPPAAAQAALGGAPPPRRPRRALCAARTTAIAGWGEVSGRRGRGREARRGAGDDGAEAAAAQGGAMVTTATTQTRLREEVRLLLLDDDGGGGADQRDLQRILGGRGPNGDRSRPPWGRRGVQWKRRRLGLGSKPRPMIPCRKVGCVYTVVDCIAMSPQGGIYESTRLGGQDTSPRDKEGYHGITSILNYHIWSCLI